jgi:hypothetical protein
MSMLFPLKACIPSSFALKTVFHLVVLLSLFTVPAGSQNKTREQSSLPKYDLQTEMKAKGVVDDVKPLQLGTKEDTTELMVKSGSDLLVIFLCPKAYQEEMSISFTKGDEIALTGSKVKREGSDIVLVREVVKGNDTMVLRDDKGNPVWNWHTGK